MLHDELKKLNKYPFHMPGHKRNKKFGICGADIDITEIAGYDDLHDPNGLIRETEEKLSCLYNSKSSALLVNGSTVGILSAVFAMTNEGDTVIVAANCHKSVYNACSLRKLNVLIANPEFDCRNGIYTRLRQEEIDRITAKHPEVKLIIITSPTYEGYISGIESSIPVLIDAAHGAHLPFCSFGNYPQGDIVISSLHKTLPALTQTAVANIYKEEWAFKFRHYLDIFETSSPSYVLMNSVSVCTEYLENNWKDFFCFEKALKQFYENTKLNHLTFLVSDDPSKINLSVAGCAINGNELAEKLRNEYNIECESAQLRHIILMATIGDEESAFNKLSTALLKVDRTIPATRKPPLSRPLISDKIYSFAVSNHKTTQTEFERSAGKRSAEFVYAYPPGIPILFPNEKITQESINYIMALVANGVNIKSTGKLLPRFILTKQEQ